MVTSETLNSLSGLIGNLGFPIVITLYLFIRFEKKLDQMNGKIERLEQAVKDTAKH